jgi:predicted esterase
MRPALKYVSICAAFLFLLLTSGCNHTGSEEHPVQYMMPVLDSCNEEPDHLYTISLPDQIPDQQRLPLILLIDPHGDGKLAVEKFTAALTDIPAVIAGSEKIRNNDPEFMSSLEHLAGDVRTKYPVDPDQLIVAGFSGGARMAYYFGMNHNVLGIIMYGAGPDRSARDAGTRRMYLASGTRDFNFMEQYLPPFQGLYDPRNYLPDFFRGSHEWPPAEYIYESVAYILKDEADLPAFIPLQISKRMLTAYDSLRASNELFFAALALEKAWIFNTEPKQKSRLARQINEFNSMPGWIQYNRNFERALQQELRLKQTYVDKLADADTAWWKKEIQGLNNRIQSTSDPETEDLLYRLKGFIGIILYSQINSLLQDERPSPELDRLLTIYELAEPESEDLARFKEQIRRLHGVKSSFQ